MTPSTPEHPLRLVELHLKSLKKFSIATIEIIRSR